MSIVRLTTALLLFSASLAWGQELPEWLEGMAEDRRNERSQQRTPAAEGRSDPAARSEPAAPGLERRSSLGGPFLEEYIIRPSRGQETIGDQGPPAAPVRPPQDLMDLSGPPAPASAAPGLAPAISSLPQEGSRYRIQPSDVLTVSVWREPELEREVTVSPDGWISYPLLGELHVEDQTVEEVRGRIEAALARLISGPAVSVSIRQTLGNRVYVIGNVNNPGVYGFSKQLDVMQALSLAGGIGKFAEAGRIRILRRAEDGSQRTLPFDYAAVTRGRALDQNVLLSSGDVVVVP